MYINSSRPKTAVPAASVKHEGDNKEFEYVSISKDEHEHVLSGSTATIIPSAKTASVIATTVNALCYN